MWRARRASSPFHRRTAWRRGTAGTLAWAGRSFRCLTGAYLSLRASDVALKVVTQALGKDTELLARLEREVKLVRCMVTYGHRLGGRGELGRHVDHLRTGTDAKEYGLFVFIATAYDF